MIAWDAPFVPDEPGERLKQDGSRDTSALIVEHTDADGVVYVEVKF